MCQKTDPDGLLTVAGQAVRFGSTERRLFLLAGLAVLAIPIGLDARHARRHYA